MAQGIRLYHGSNVPIEHPDVTFNTGFADLGKGFYLTPDYPAACGRARKRARDMGGTATVSVFELDPSCVPWATWGSQPPALPSRSALFGLDFEKSAQGYAAWAGYIKACRNGKTVVAGIGSPAIAKAWIATMEIEMVCSGFLSPEEFAQAVDPTELVVQYCILSQSIADRHLEFVDSKQTPSL